MNIAQTRPCADPTNKTLVLTGTNGRNVNITGLSPGTRYQITAQLLYSDYISYESEVIEITTRESEQGKSFDIDSTNSVSTYTIGSSSLPRNQEETIMIKPWPSSTSLKVAAQTSVVGSLLQAAGNHSSFISTVLLGKSSAVSSKIEFDNSQTKSKMVGSTGPGTRFSVSSSSVFPAWLSTSSRSQNDSDQPGGLGISATTSSKTLPVTQTQAIVDANFIPSSHRESTRRIFGSSGSKLEMSSADPQITLMKSFTSVVTSSGFVLASMNYKSEEKSASEFTGTAPGETITATSFNVLASFYLHPVELTSSFFKPEASISTTTELLASGFISSQKIRPSSLRASQENNSLRSVFEYTASSNQLQRSSTGSDHTLVILGTENMQQSIISYVKSAFESKTKLDASITQADITRANTIHAGTTYAKRAFSYASPSLLSPGLPTSSVPFYSSVESRYTPCWITFYVSQSIARSSYPNDSNTSINLRLKALQISSVPDKLEPTSSTSQTDTSITAKPAIHNDVHSSQSFDNKQSTYKGLSDSKSSLNAGFDETVSSIRVSGLKQSTSQASVNSPTAITAPSYIPKAYNNVTVISASVSVLSSFSPRLATTSISPTFNSETSPSTSSTFVITDGSFINPGQPIGGGEGNIINRKRRELQLGRLSSVLLMSTDIYSDSEVSGLKRLMTSSLGLCLVKPSMTNPAELSSYPTTTAENLLKSKTLFTPASTVSPTSFPNSYIMESNREAPISVYNSLSLQSSYDVVLEPASILSGSVINPVVYSDHSLVGQSDQTARGSESTFHEHSVLIWMPDSSPPNNIEGIPKSTFQIEEIIPARTSLVSKAVDGLSTNPVFLLQSHTASQSVSTPLLPSSDEPSAIFSPSFIDRTLVDISGLEAATIYQHSVTTFPLSPSNDVISTGADSAIGITSVFDGPDILTSTHIPIPYRGVVSGLSGTHSAQDHTIPLPSYSSIESRSSGNIDYSVSRPTNSLFEDVILFSSFSSQDFDSLSSEKSSASVANSTLSFKSKNDHFMSTESMNKSSLMLPNTATYPLPTAQELTNATKDFYSAVSSSELETLLTSSRQEISLTSEFHATPTGELPHAKTGIITSSFSSSEVSEIGTLVASSYVSESSSIQVGPSTDYITPSYATLPSDISPDNTAVITSSASSFVLEVGSLVSSLKMFENATASLQSSVKAPEVVDQSSASNLQRETQSGNDFLSTWSTELPLYLSTSQAGSVVATDLSPTELRQATATDETSSSDSPISNSTLSRYTPHSSMFKYSIQLSSSLPITTGASSSLATESTQILSMALAISSAVGPYISTSHTYSSKGISFTTSLYQSEPVIDSSTIAKLENTNLGIPSSLTNLVSNTEVSISSTISDLQASVLSTQIKLPSSRIEPISDSTTVSSKILLKTSDAGPYVNVSYALFTSSSTNILSTQIRSNIGLSNSKPGDFSSALMPLTASITRETTAISTGTVSTLQSTSVLPMPATVSSISLNTQDAIKETVATKSIFSSDLKFASPVSYSQTVKYSEQSSVYPGSDILVPTELSTRSTSKSLLLEKPSLDSIAAGVATISSLDLPKQSSVYLSSSSLALIESPGNSTSKSYTLKQPSKDRSTYGVSSTVLSVYLPRQSSPYPVYSSSVSIELASPVTSRSHAFENPSKDSSMLSLDVSKKSSVRLESVSSVQTVSQRASTTTSSLLARPSEDASELVTASKLLSASASSLSIISEASYTTTTLAISASASRISFAAITSSLLQPSCDGSSQQQLLSRNRTEMLTRYSFTVSSDLSTILVSSSLSISWPKYLQSSGSTHASSRSSSSSSIIRSEVTESSVKVLQSSTSALGSISAGSSGPMTSIPASPSSSVHTSRSSHSQISGSTASSIHSSSSIVLISAVESSVKVLQSSDTMLLTSVLSPSSSLSYCHRHHHRVSN